MGAATPRAGKARWTDLRKRVLSAILIGPAALGFILLGGLPWTLLITLAALVLAWEWVRLCGQDIRALPGARATGAARLEAWGPLTFSAREELLAWRDSAWQRCGGVVGLAGARVIPLPHQLLESRRNSNDG